MKKRNIKRIISPIITAAATAFILGALPASMFAQDAGPSALTGASALYRVMWVVLAAWAGIAAYLAVIDRKVSRLEKERRDG